MTTRTYVGAGITIHWDGDRCVHAQRCVDGAPSVFDRQADPWVNPAAGTAAEIARVVDRCPSGALSYTRRDGAPSGRRGRVEGDDPAASSAARRPSTHPDLVATAYRAVPARTSRSTINP